MFDFPEPGEPCRQLIIVPPEGAVFDAPEVHAAIKEFLDSHVPDFSYVVSATSPFRDDTFIVAPVVNAGSVGEAPPLKRLAEIRRLLFKAFIGRPGSMLQ